MFLAGALSSKQNLGDVSFGIAQKELEARHLWRASCAWVTLDPLMTSKQWTEVAGAHVVAVMQKTTLPATIPSQQQVPWNTARPAAEETAIAKAWSSTAAVDARFGFVPMA